MLISVLWVCTILQTIGGTPVPGKDGDTEEPEELFEGDIMGIEGSSFVEQLNSSESQANAVMNEELKWEQATVPYEISSSFYSKYVQRRSKDQTARIKKAMDNIMDNTCVHFIQKTKEKQFIKIMAGVRCSSNVGKMLDPQTVELSSNSCPQLGQILHELMHALGFYHEQSRKDRDQYIEINWNNIPANFKNNFLDYLGNVFGLHYDYDSVMHYSNNSFAIDPNEWTIRPRPPNQTIEIGQRTHLSELDIKRINKLYRCEEDKKRVCGYLWEERNFTGLMTAIYEATIESYYKKNQRKYSSAKIFSGCQVTLRTKDDQVGIRFLPDNFPNFQKKHRSFVTTLSCTCN